MHQTSLSPAIKAPVAPFLIYQTAQGNSPALSRPLPVNLTPDEIRAMVRDILG